MKKYRGWVCAAVAVLAASALFAEDDDIGMQFEHLLAAQAVKWFGVIEPLAAPAGPADYVPRELATANQRVKLAKGLTAEYVTRGVATLADMISFWPDAVNPTHLILCIEGGRNSGGTNPGVQRVSLADGSVQTILFGTSRCDGIRTTPWGTILATEETTDGRAYEILNPLTTTGHWIESRSTGVVRTGIGGGNPLSSAVAQRQALPTMAWEGLAVLPSGVVIAGDELRPGSGTLDKDGGAIFKFVPTSPHGGGTISDLANSPLNAGNVYAMSVSCVGSGNSFPQYGQGCEIGTAVWVKVNALSATADADARGATGYYRPEDLHEDPEFEGTGVRFCWANTGENGSGNFAEVVCGVDSKPMPASPTEWTDGRTNFQYLADGAATRTNVTTAVVNRFIEGDPRFNSFDNLDFQPHTRNLYVIEDDDFGEIFACLPDGADRDIKSDGCIGILSVVDPRAEPTGFIFDASGEVAYVVIQHGETPASLGPTDDLIKITGFKVKKKKN